MLLNCDNSLHCLLNCSIISCTYSSTRPASLFCLFHETSSIFCSKWGALLQNFMIKYLMKDVDLLCPWTEFCLSGRLIGEKYLSNCVNYLSHLKELERILSNKKKQSLLQMHITQNTLHYIIKTNNRDCRQSIFSSVKIRKNVLKTP